MKEHKKRILKIAVPIMLSNLISQLQMLIDRVFLGKLSIASMSAVGNATTPISTTTNAYLALTLGSTILISQAVGSSRKEDARELAASLFKYSNLVAAALFAVWMTFPRLIFTWMGVDSSIIDMSVAYARFYSPVFLVIGLSSSMTCILQVSEKTKILAVYGALRAAVNIVLDYALIFGRFGLPEMGVAGAALATAIAEYAGVFVILCYVLRDRSLYLRPRAKELLRAKAGLYWNSVKMGLPSGIEEFAWNLGNLFLVVMLNRISPEAAGIYTIVLGVMLIPSVVFVAFGNAVLTLSGQETGKGNPKGIGEFVKISLRWAVLLSAGVLALFLLFPEAIIGCFTADGDIIASSTLYLLIVGINLFPKSMNIIIGAGVKGHGDTRWMLGTQIFGTIFVIGVSAILVIGFQQGIASLFMLVVADETVRCILNGWKLRRITAGR